MSTDQTDHPHQDAAVRAAERAMWRVPATSVDMRDLARAAVAAARPAIEREAKVAGLRDAALSLKIGQLVGARQLDAMADLIEREADQ